MNDINKWLFVVPMVVLLIGGSCSRDPDRDQVSASGKAHSDDVNNALTKGEDESPRVASESSTSRDVATNMDGDGRKTRVAAPAPMASWGSHLDINSGDLQSEVVSLDGLVQHKTYESRLSREVRRLGIPIPEERNWQRISGGYAGPFVYGDVLTTAYLLLDLLDRAHAADQDRRSILERFMTNMRTGDPLRVAEKAHMLVVEFADLHGLESPYTPEHTRQLRWLREHAAQEKRGEN